MPKISIVIPNYNHARYLKQRLETVLGQTFQDFEVIYLDDASTDQSAEVFEAFAGDPRLRAVLNSRNSGVPFKQWNKGVREAKGEYIWLAEADDFADLRWLETLVALLDLHPGVGVAFCQSVVVDENGTELGLEQGGHFIAPQQWQHDFVMNGRDYARHFMLFDNTIPNASAVLFRKSVYEAAGYANENLRLTGDWVMWLQMLQRADVAFVARPLNFFRTHSHSVRNRSEKAGVLAEERYLMARFLLRHLSLESEQIEELLHRSMETWREALFSPSSRRDWRRHRRIYRVARRIDAQIHLRLVRHLGYRTLRDSRFFESARSTGRALGKWKTRG